MASRQRTDHTRLVEDLHRRLDERLGELTTSDDWLAYLATARRFHRYSPNNQLLLALQGAEGLVASYSRWTEIPAVGGGNCQVAKGQKGLSILAPMTVRSTEVDDATGEETTRRRLRGFRTVKVFHQGQLVAPPDIGESVMPELLTGENRWQHVWSAVAGRIEAEGFSVARATRGPRDSWNGMTSWSDRNVLVAGDLEPPHALKTLLHEWGHVELDHEHRTELSRHLKEVEAESVAYLLAQTVGLDSGAYSVPYISVWAHGDIELARRVAEQVLATTKRLVDHLEIDLGIELAPDVIERSRQPVDAEVVPIHTGRANADVVPPSGWSRETSRGGEFEAMTLPGIPGNPPDSAAAVVDIDTRRFIKATIADLEPDRHERIVELVFDPAHAAETATILAESGKSATQIARLMEHLDFDITTIRNALLTRVDDRERPTLFGIADVRTALAAVDDTIDLDVLVPLVERPQADFVPDALDADDPLDDLRVIHRALRRRAEPSRVAALAHGLRVEPATVIGLCRATHTQPSEAMAVAIAIHNGDTRAAYRDVTTAWPDVKGGWECHTHPSLGGATPIAVVPDYDPTREILDKWTGRTPAGRTGPTPPPTPA